VFVCEKEWDFNLIKTVLKPLVLMLHRSSWIFRRTDFDRPTSSSNCHGDLKQPAFFPASQCPLAETYTIKTIHFRYTPTIAFDLFLAPEPLR
jgi:hypothetical protein